MWRIGNPACLPFLPLFSTRLGADRVAASVVNWLVLLGIVVVIVAIAAVTGVKAKGTRHVAGSRMMGMGRIALIVIFVIIAWVAFQARSGG